MSFALWLHWACTDALTLHCRTSDLHGGCITGAWEIGLVAGEIEDMETSPQLRKSYYASPEQRIRLVAGLRALAEFIESNPSVPMPATGDVMVFPAGGTDEQERAEIDTIATLIGAEAHWTVGDHYVVSRHFGPVEYRAVAIPSSNGMDGE
jgi:hypothetical protein